MKNYKEAKISFKEFIYKLFEDDEDNKKIEFKDYEIMVKFEEKLISEKEHKLYNIAIERKTLWAKTDQIFIIFEYKYIIDLKVWKVIE